MRHRTTSAQCDHEDRGAERAATSGCQVLDEIVAEVAADSATTSSTACTADAGLSRAVARRRIALVVGRDRDVVEIVTDSLKRGSRRIRAYTPTPRRGFMRGGYRRRDGRCATLSPAEPAA